MDSFYKIIGKYGFVLIILFIFACIGTYLEIIFPDMYVAIWTFVGGVDFIVLSKLGFFE